MRRQPFDFDISVTADKKRRARGRGFSGVVESSERVCERQGCDRPGKYRAPKSPDNLEEFHWFCLDHVREYNLRWNFFESYSDLGPRAAVRRGPRLGPADAAVPRGAGPGGAGARRGAGVAAVRLRRPERLPRRQGDAEPRRRADAAAAAAADRAAGAGDPRGAGHPEQGRDPPAVQGAGQGPAPRHERRPPRRRGAARRGGLGLGADQGRAAASATDQAAARFDARRGRAILGRRVERADRHVAERPEQVGEGEAGAGGGAGRQRQRAGDDPPWQPRQHAGAERQDLLGPLRHPEQPGMDERADRPADGRVDAAGEQAGESGRAARAAAAAGPPRCGGPSAASASATAKQPPW